MIKALGLRQLRHMLTIQVAAVLRTWADSDERFRRNAFNSS